MPTWKKIIVSGSNVSELHNDAGYITAGGTAVAGSEFQIQYNSSSAFGATSSFTFNYNTNTLQLTGSFINTAGGITGSLLGTASYAVSTSYALNSQTASYVTLAQTASYAIGYVLSTSTGSFILASQTASMLSPYLLIANTSSFIKSTQTSSMAVGTASYTPNAIVTASASSNVITFTKGNGSTFTTTIETASILGPGESNTLALWNSTSSITSSSINLYTGATATSNAVVENLLYDITIDGIKISNSKNITSSINSNVFVDNISPAGDVIAIDPASYVVIKKIDLYRYNILNRSGCHGLTLDFNLVLCNNSLLGSPADFTYDNRAWPATTVPYYSETGRIYLSWLGADPVAGGAVGQSNTVTYITMNPTLTNAVTAGWDVVDPGTLTFPSATSLAASEEGVAVPFNVQVYRDTDGGYQFGYKLVNNPGSSEWYVEIALYNDTSSTLRISHVSKILTLFTNP